MYKKYSTTLQCGRFLCVGVQHQFLLLLGSVSDLSDCKITFSTRFLIQFSPHISFFVSVLKKGQTDSP